MAVNSRRFLRKLVNNEVLKANQILDTLYGAKYHGRKISAFVQGSLSKYDSLLVVKSKSDPSDKFFSQISENTHMTVRQLQDRLELLQEFTEGRRWDGWDLDKIFDEAQYRADVAGLEVEDFLDFWDLARTESFDYIGDSETYVDLAYAAVDQVGFGQFKKAIMAAKKQAKAIASQKNLSTEEFEILLTQKQVETIERLSNVIR